MKNQILTALLLIFIRSIRTFWHSIAGVSVRDAEANAAFKLVFSTIGHPVSTAAVISQ